MSKEKHQKKMKIHSSQPGEPSSERSKKIEVDFEEKYKRALADYQNLLKRTAREKEDFYKYASEQVILDFIPVYNNLKMAVRHAGENSDSWLEGVKYTVKQFSEVLKNLGVEEIRTKHAQFDPRIMEAVEGEGDRVKKEVMPGYKLKGRLIIPAKVIVE